MSSNFAFVFDLDGTITDSVALVNIIMKEISSKCKIELTEEKKQEVDEVVTEILNQENFKRIGVGFLLKIYKIIGLKFFQRLRALLLTNKIYKREVVKVKLFEGTEKLFEFFDERSTPYAIATFCSMREAHQRLTNYPELLSKFEGKIITRDMVKRIKPHPEQLEKVAEILKIPTKNLVMVGDMQADIRMGKNTGCKTIGVLSGYATRAKMEEVECDFIFDTIADIIDNFEEIKKK